MQALLGSFRTFLAFLVLFIVCDYGLAKVVIEDYAMLPEHRNVVLSPDGIHYAVIVRVNDSESITVVNVESEEIVSVSNLGSLKARDISFAGNNFVLFTAPNSFVGEVKNGYKYEWSVLYSIDITTGGVVPLLRFNSLDSFRRSFDRIPTSLTASILLSSISGLDAEKEFIYMSAYSVGGSFRSSTHQRTNLFQVNLKSGTGKLHANGNNHTVQWFVGEDGIVLAQESYNDRNQVHKIYSYISGKRRLIYEHKAATPDANFEAIADDERSLLYIKGGTIYQLSLDDGTTSNSSYTRAGNSVRSLNTDLSKKLTSISYNGLQAFDEQVRPEVVKSLNLFKKISPRNHLKLMASNDAGTQIVVRVSGNDSAGNYVYFDRKTHKVKVLGQEYSKVIQKSIGEISPFYYKSRDGASIPSVITWPVGVEPSERKKLPLLVFPHDQPNDVSHVEFNWWAQYFARKGYVILQPNFRGTSGLGYVHQSQGYQEDGQTMQRDVSDGVGALVATGQVDADRVCIMGKAHGAYIALASGALSSERYRCVVSVSGISDMQQMIKDTDARKRGRYPNFHDLDKTFERYKSDSDQLKSISPLKFVTNYVAPVLLMHSKDDWVVPFKHSQKMHKALLKAGKNSQLIELKADDHSRSRRQGRLQMLKAIDAFLNEYNPV